MIFDYIRQAYEFITLYVPPKLFWAVVVFVGVAIWYSLRKN